MPLDSQTWDSLYSKAPIKIVVYHQDGSRSYRVIFPYKTEDQKRKYLKNSIKMLQDMDNTKKISVAQYYQKSDNRLIAEYKQGLFISHENFIL